VLLFAHYSLPHVPYVYEIDKFQPSLNPFEENVEKYVMQLEYVDKMIGELIEKIRNEKKLEESTIILLSDHGLRHTLDNSEFNHVPMIVYKGNNPIYKKVNNKVQTEEVIKSIIEKN
jgi:membrane-anchored protein YejM (alkaline phosphatase superfamily)